MPTANLRVLSDAMLMDLALQAMNELFEIFLKPWTKAAEAESDLRLEALEMFQLELDWREKTHFHVYPPASPLHYLKLIQMRNRLTELLVAWRKDIKADIDKKSHGSN